MRPSLREAWSLLIVRCEFIVGGGRWMGLIRRGRVDSLSRRVGVNSSRQFASTAVQRWWEYEVVVEAGCGGERRQRWREGACPRLLFQPDVARSCELWVGCRTGRGQLHNQLSSGSSGPVRPDSGRRSSGIPACSPTSSAVLDSWSHPML